MPTSATAWPSEAVFLNEASQPACTLSTLLLATCRLAQRAETIISVQHRAIPSFIETGNRTESHSHISVQYGVLRL